MDFLIKIVWSGHLCPYQNMGWLHRFEMFVRSLRIVLPDVTGGRSWNVSSVLTLSCNSDIVYPIRFFRHLSSMISRTPAFFTFAINLKTYYRIWQISGIIAPEIPYLCQNETFNDTYSPARSVGRMPARRVTVGYRPSQCRQHRLKYRFSMD